MTESLGERLKAATKDLHHEVERAPFMRALLRGTLDRPSYALLLRNLHAIYSELEGALDAQAANAPLQSLRLTGMPRRQALAQDLLVLHGPLWSTQLAVVEAGERYAHHLQHLAHVSPLALAAHVYVRYLGDLSGGQLLAPIVERSLGLAAGQGSAFYDFGGDAQSQALAQRLRAALDRLVDSEPDVGADLVLEAQFAFELHRKLFDELARICRIGSSHPEDTTLLSAAR